jgi:hypothetical protein
MSDRFDTEVLQHLPLSEAVLLLAHHTASPEVLNDLFERHRGSAYQRQLSFATLVHLIGDALVQHAGSGRQSFARARHEQALPVSIQAAYQKLGRLPLAVSEALLAESTQRLLPLLPATHAPSDLPDTMAAWTMVVVDGKVVKRVPKRLRPLRGWPGGVVGGKALVALDLRRRLALALATHADGQTNEAKLVPALLPRVRAHAPAVLWIADAQFGNPAHIAAFTARPGDHALVRYDGKSAFRVDPERSPRSGVDRRGRRYDECWGWLGGPRNRYPTYVRRIVLERPGEETLILLTDLLDPQAYAADDVLEVYWQRWGIERVFQEITEVFQLQHLIGTTPQGTVLQLALCLWWYNVIQVVRAYVAQGADVAVAEVSSELLFRDVQRQLITLYELLSPAQVIARLDVPPTVAQLCRRLRHLLHPLWTERWRKAPPKKSRPGPRPRGRQACTSAYRLIHEDQLGFHKPVPM